LAAGGIARLQNVAARLMALKMTGANPVARAENACATDSGFFVCGKTDKHQAERIPAMVS
jgi:hypothetical protein